MHIDAPSFMAPRSRKHPPRRASSAAADHVHNLDHVAVGERPGGVLGARYDRAIQLDGDRAIAEPEQRDERRDRDRRGELARLAVNHDTHEASLMGGP